MALKDEQAYLTGEGRIFIKISVTDTAYGSMIFYFSDSFFSATNAYGGPQVYAPVVEWGSLRKFLSLDGRQREGDVLLDFYALEYVVDSGSNLRFQFMSLINEVNFRDALVEFYQWNSSATTQEKIWAGYWDGIQEYATRNKVPIVTIRLKPRLKAQENAISTMVLPGSFPDAPSESFGKMVSVNYGDNRIRIAGGGSWMDNFIMCHPIPGAAGVIISRGDSGGRVALKIRFSKTDGVVADQEFIKGTNNSFTANSGIFVYDDLAQMPALINPISIASITTDSAKAEVEVFLASELYIALKPSDTTSNNTWPTPTKLVNDDPSDFADSTDSLFLLEMNAPFPPGLLGSVVEAYVAVDVENTAGASRDCRISFINQHTGAVVVPTTFTLGAGAARQIKTMAHLAGLLPTNVAGTQAEFSHGKLITRSGAGDERAIGLRFDITGGAGNRAGVRVRGISLVFRYRADLVAHRGGLFGDWNYVSFITPGLFEQLIQMGRVKAGDYQLVSDLRFFAVGGWQKDNGAGDITGTASAIIDLLPDIVSHLISIRAGEQITVGTNTLGSVVDARDSISGLGEYDGLFLTHGETPTKLSEVIAKIETEFPARIVQEDSVWNLIPDTPNPHSARYYRSTSEIIRIEPEDIVLDSLRVWEDPYDDIINNVAVQYGHAFGNNRPQKVVEYQNPLSVRYFGARQQQTIKAPSIVQQVVGAHATPAAATAIAKFHAQRKSRPRLNVIVQLAQKFYDLKRGHVLQFGSLEKVGIRCPAFRNGRLDYVHFRADSGPFANQADDTTPQHIPGGTVTSEIYFFASHRARSVTVTPDGAGSYTTVASGWEYYNGSGWTAFSNVTRSDGGDPLAVFKAAAGTYTVTWDDPDPWLWRKSEITLVSTVVGPGYAFRMKYNTSLASTLGTDLIRIADVWRGRDFEVVEVTRKPGSGRSYPVMEAVLREVM